MLQTNQIYLGDCLSVMQEIDDKSVDLIIIDPPYLTTKEKWDKIEVVNQELSKQLFRIAKDSCSLYVWCGIGEKSQSLIRWFPIFSQDWYFKDLITWKKQRGIGMRKGWLYTREELLWFVKDNKQFVWNADNQYSKEKRGKLGFDIIPKNENKRLTNVWTDILENLYSMGKFQKNLLHFTPKPISALERIIKSHTKENDLVLDCFFGSGSTGLACQNLNRQFIGIEKEEKYFNIAKEKLNL